MPLNIICNFARAIFVVFAVIFFLKVLNVVLISDVMSDASKIILILEMEVPHSM